MMRVALVVLVCAVALGCAQNSNCSSIADRDKVDCLPNGTKGPCLLQGCCWNPSSSPGGQRARVVFLFSLFTSRAVPWCFYPAGTACSGSPIDGSTLQRLLGPGGAGPVNLNPGSFFTMQVRQLPRSRSRSLRGRQVRACNSVTGCGPWMANKVCFLCCYAALVNPVVRQWSLVLVSMVSPLPVRTLISLCQDSSMNIANTSFLIAVTSNSVVQIWAQESLKSNCESNRAQLSLQNGQFALSSFSMWHAGGNDCHTCALLVPPPPPRTLTLSPCQRRLA